MRELPRPGTFAEGQRYIYGLLASAAFIDRVLRGLPDHRDSVLSDPRYAGGMAFGSDCGSLEYLVREVKAVAKRPIIVKLSIHGTTSRYASSIGNPLLWIAASVSLIADSSGPLLHTFRAGLRRALDRLRAPELRPTWVLATGWFAAIFPWIVARGSYVFMYHYLPAYAFALIYLAGSAAKLERERPRLAFGFVSLVFLVSAYFVPVWGEFPVTEAEANHRLVFRSWRP